MISLTNKKYHILVLVLLSLLLFFWKINVIPLTDGDSAFYAKIAKNIVETGDWLTMHYGDAGTIIDKPPLMMWLTAISFKIFGFNDFAVTFWHSIFALLIVFFTYQTAKLVFDENTAFISSLILITSAQFFYQARSPLQDIPLTLFILLSIYMFLLYERSGKLGYFYLSPLFVSLAVLTKGPVGLALPAIILLIYMLIKRVKLPGILHVALATMLFFAVAAPWFIVEYRLLGQKFLDLFIGHNFGRYLKPVDTIGGEATKYAAIQPQYDIYSYFLQIFILFVPWSGFFYPALYYSFKKRSKPLPVIYALSIILFFSLSLNYKISRYILPAFPALAMITGKMLSDLMINGDPDAKRPSILSAILTLLMVTVPLLVLVFVLFFVRFADVSGYYSQVIVSFLIPMTLGLVIGSIVIFFRMYRQAFDSFLIFTIIAYLFFIFDLSIFFPRVNPISTFCSRINAVAKPSDIVCQYMGTDAHFMIYYAKSNVTFIRDTEKMKELLLSDRKVYCVTENAEAYNKLRAPLKERIKELGKSANYTLFTN